LVSAGGHERGAARPRWLGQGISKRMFVRAAKKPEDFNMNRKR
jgi:hypothetical protein